jgi:hypothetical protein
MENQTNTGGENKYIEVFPDKIILSRPLEQNHYEARLTLTNLTDKYVVYKVYINNNAIYSATPSTGFIKPKEITSVNIKRLEKEPKGGQETKDKFLILAFPVNQVLTDNKEAIAIVKGTNMKSGNNQEIYLETQFDQASYNVGRQTMYNQSPSNRLSVPVTSGGNLNQTSNPFNDNMESNFSSTGGTALNTVEDYKKAIDEIKKKYQEYEVMIDKYNNQLTNLNLSSNLLKAKNRGIYII